MPYSGQPSPPVATLYRSVLSLTGSVIGGQADPYCDAGLRPLPMTELHRSLKARLSRQPRRGSANTGRGCRARPLKRTDVQPTVAGLCRLYEFFP